MFFLSTSRTQLLLANHLIIQERTKFDTEQKSSKFQPELGTLVSSAYNTGSDTERVLRGGSFIYIYYEHEALDLFRGEFRVSVYPSENFELYYVICCCCFYLCCY